MQLLLFYRNTSYDGSVLKPCGDPGLMIDIMWELVQVEKKDIFRGGR